MTWCDPLLFKLEIFILLWTAFCLLFHFIIFWFICPHAVPKSFPDKTRINEKANVFSTSISDGIERNRIKLGEMGNEKNTRENISGNNSFLIGPTCYAVSYYFICMCCYALNSAICTPHTTKGCLIRKRVRLFMCLIKQIILSFIEVRKRNGCQTRLRINRKKKRVKCFLFQDHPT